jgi:CBS domain-containing membrane protein
VLAVSGTAAYLNEQPLANSASPRILVEGVTPLRIDAAALSLGLTGAVLLLLRASHPPAGATVLIVSLGLLTKPSELAAIMAGVVILTVAGWAINRAFGVPMPAWSSRG